MRGGKIVDWDPDVVDREYLDSGKPLVNIPLKSLKLNFFFLCCRFYCLELTFLVTLLLICHGIIIIGT